CILEAEQHHRLARPRTPRPPHGHARRELGPSRSTHQLEERRQAPPAPAPLRAAHPRRLRRRLLPRGRRTSLRSRSLAPPAFERSGELRVLLERLGRFLAARPDPLAAEREPGTILLD